MSKELLELCLPHNWRHAKLPTHNWIPIMQVTPVRYYYMATFETDLTENKLILDMSHIDQNQSQNTNKYSS